MLKLKEELINAYVRCKIENSLTAKDLATLSKLSEVQINYILKHNAKKVSIEKMEQGLYNIGFVICSIEWTGR